MDTLQVLDKNGDLHIMTVEGHIQIFKNCKIKNMITPVKCNHCGNIYDLTAVTVNHRYADCDQFTTPCCNYRFADTREWKSFKDFERIDLKNIKIIE